MSSGGQILPADVQELVQERIHTQHLGGYQQEEGFIERIFEVRQFAVGQTHDKEVEELADTQMEEVEIGQDVPMGGGKEKYLKLIKRRKYGIAIDVPKDLVDMIQRGAQTTNSRGLDTLMQMVTSPSRAFGKERARREEETAADMFNKGALTAGDPVFDNSVDLGDVIKDPSGDFIYDGKPAFAELGASEHVSHAGTAYRNLLLGAPLSPTNVEALANIAEDENAFDEQDRTINNLADTILVSRSKKDAVNRIVRGATVPQPGTLLTSNNPLQRLTPIIWPYLKNPDAYFIGRARDGVVFYRTGAPRIEFGMDAKKDMMTIAVYAYWGMAWLQWRRWAAANLPTA